MGAIQGAINGALGTVAATAVAGKHMKEKSELKAEQAKEKSELKAEQAKEKSELKAEQGELAKEQYYEAGAAIKELQGQLSDKKNEWGEAEGDLAILEAKRPGGKGNTKASLDEKRKAKMSEIEAAQRAFDELSDRIEAKKAMMSRAELIMNKANKWGGLK